jgi:hypothetical protein
MSDKKEITLKLNKREVEVIKIALFFLSDDIRHGSLRPKTSDEGDIDTLQNQANINNLYNIESIQNKIKKEKEGL